MHSGDEELEMTKMVKVGRKAIRLRKGNIGDESKKEAGAEREIQGQPTERSSTGFAC